MRNKAELILLAVKRLAKLMVTVLEEGVTAQAAVRVLMVTLQAAEDYIYISIGRVNFK